MLEPAMSAPKGRADFEPSLPDRPFISVRMARFAMEPVCNCRTAAA
jgi:hypothetical protein